MGLLRSNGSSRRRFIHHNQDLKTPEDFLGASLLLSKTLPGAPRCPYSDTPRSPLSESILWRSQWKCMTRSYCAVIEALIEHYTWACSTLKVSAQDIMRKRLILPLQDLYEAVKEGKRCLEKLAQVPKRPTQLLSWLDEMVLKRDMKNDVVDVHLQRLLWTSAVVRDLLLSSAPDLDGFESYVEKHTMKLCEIWNGMDVKDDVRAVQVLLQSNMSESEGSSHHGRKVGQAPLEKRKSENRRKCLQLSSFILQKWEWFLTNSQLIMEINDLPKFLWVDPKGFKKAPTLIGRGSSANVFESTWLGCRLAVKEFFGEEDVRFRMEATLQVQAQHPNVVTVICFTKDSSKRTCSLVMERMHQDLRQLMKQKMSNKSYKTVDSPFSLLHSVDLMLQIAQGMEYLHRNDIMHRDLKSSNILVNLSSKDGSYARDVSSHVHLKIADFGTAAEAMIESTTYMAQSVGTTRWMAPEVLEHWDAARYSKKADVYSFGIVCYEVLTGKTPYESVYMRNMKETVVIRGDRPRLPQTSPPALSSFIEQCWRAEPYLRPTFTEICRMLRYLKACICLRGDKTDRYHNLLMQPLSTTIFNDIDTMIQRRWKQYGVSHPQVAHVLAIPVEMYCCRELLLSDTQLEPDSKSEHSKSFQVEAMVEQGVEVLGSYSGGHC